MLIPKYVDLVTFVVKISTETPWLKLDFPVQPQLWNPVGVDVHWTGLDIVQVILRHDLILLVVKEN